MTLTASGLGYLIAVVAVVLASPISCQPAQAKHGWQQVAHIKAGRTPGPVTLGGSWAFIPNTSDGTVTQVKRDDGTVVATIRVSDPELLRAQGCAPDSVHAYHSASWGWRACDTPYALAWDGSSIWAIDNGLRRLVKVDPRLHKVTGGVDLPGTGWNAVASASTIWVTGWDEDALYIVDVGTQRLVRTLRDLDQGPSSVVLGSGSVWVVCARGVGRLARFDASTFQPLGRYEIEWWSLSAAAYRDAIYIRGTNGGDVSRLDPTNGTTIWSELGPGFIGRNGIDQIAATSDGVWVAGTATERLDAHSGRVVETLPIPATSVAAQGGELWIARLDGTVSELRRQ